MSPLPLNLIRYLIVCRVNASMVWLSPDPAVEFSLVLGTFIQESLPTIQARPWRKALVPWKEHGGLSAIKKRSLKAIPGAAWPVEAVIFCYPGKRAYGKGELIMLELKLIGESADHSFFLETILPKLLHRCEERILNTTWEVNVFDEQMLPQLKKIQQFLLKGDRKSSLKSEPINRFFTKRADLVKFFAGAQTAEIHP